MVRFDLDSPCYVWVQPAADMSENAILLAAFNTEATLLIRLQTNGYFDVEILNNNGVSGAYAEYKSSILAVCADRFQHLNLTIDNIKKLVKGCVNYNDIKRLGGFCGRKTLFA